MDMVGGHGVGVIPAAIERIAIRHVQINVAAIARPHLLGLTLADGMKAGTKCHHRAAGSNSRSSSLQFILSMLCP